METSNDAGLGICTFNAWSTVFTISILAPVLMGKDSLGATNVFLIFAGISIASTIFSQLVIKETQGLTDKEKKMIYTPEKFKTK
jgi:hypothetical protein